MKISAFNSLAVVVVCLPLMCGCATILKGTTEDVQIVSEPAGAEVSIDGFNYGKSPLHLALPSKKTHYIEFRKSGYEKKTVVINGDVSGGYIILDILFGLWPVVVDAATGSWYELDNTSVYVSLEPLRETKEPVEKGRDKTESPNGDREIEAAAKSQTAGANPRMDVFVDLPEVFEMELQHEVTQNILGTKCTITYLARHFSASKLLFGNIQGVWKGQTLPENQTTISVSEDDTFFLGLDQSTVYRVTVERERTKTLVLKFVKTAR